MGALLVLGSPSPAEAQVPSLYLVQNSGWMEPFFADSQSEFKPLLSALIDASRSDGEVIIASFNQDGQLAKRRSPEIVYRGPYQADAVAKGVRSIDLPVRQDGKMTDADFNGALVRGLNEVLGGQSGIVWLITNNKNSPSNSTQVSQNTRKFAEMLSESPALPFVVAYPIRMAVKGRFFEEHGLIAYGIAYGDEAAAILRRIIHQSSMTTLFKKPAVQLKPLSQAPLVFTPNSVNTPGVSAQLLADGTLLIEGLPPDGEEIDIRGSIRSGYYPHVIESAAIALSWSDLQVPGGSNGLQANIEPQAINSLGPDDILGDVSLRITTPSIGRPTGMAGLLTNDVTVPGVLAIDLKDVKMALQGDFLQQIGEITAIDQLPDVFFDYKRLTVASTTVPIQLRTHFSSWPLILGAGGLTTAAVTLGLAAILLRRSREFSLPINGVTRRVHLRPWETKRFPLSEGRTTRVTGRLFGKPRLVTDDPSKSA